MVVIASKRLVLVFSLGFIAATLVLAPLRASAQPASPQTTDPKEMARRLGEEALTLHGQGRFREAYERFETAEKIAHSPVFVLWMARSKRALGELIEAKRLSEKVVSEELAADASPKWISAQEEAKAELAALVKKIPHVRVVVVGAGTNASIDLDGAVVTAGSETEVDPGKHTAHGSSPGYPPIAKTMQVEEGQSQTIELRFVSADVAPLATRPKGSLVPGGIVLGAGLAGLAAGAATGGSALVLAGQIKEGCVGNQCRRSDQGKADDTKRLALASTVCLVAGGVLSATGTVLLIVRPRIGTDAKTVSVDIGPLNAGVTVGF